MNKTVVAPSLFVIGSARRCCRQRRDPAGRGADRPRPTNSASGFSSRTPTGHRIARWRKSVVHSSDVIRANLTCFSRGLRRP